MQPTNLTIFRNFLTRCALYALIPYEKDKKAWIVIVRKSSNVCKNDCTLD